jgi:hypothetical protein
MNFKRRQIDLHVIDALDSESARTGRSEGLALRFWLRDTSITIVSHYAWDEVALSKIIKKISTHRRAYADPRKYLPFLHIACHGLPDGLLIGDDVPVPWSKLVDILLPLQRKVDYTLPLTLSSCHGFSGYRVALQELNQFEKRRPYYVLIGPQGKLSTEELILSTADLYRGLLSEYVGLPEAVERANKHVRNSGAHLAYTYGADVVEKFDRLGVDDKKLFLPRSRNG